MSFPVLMGPRHEAGGVCVSVVAGRGARLGCFFCRSRAPSIDSQTTKF